MSEIAGTSRKKTAFTVAKDSITFEY